MTTPAGFDLVTAGGAVALTRFSARDWVETALRDRVTLYDAACEMSRGTMEGRGVVHVVAAPAGESKQWAVRRYMRGGWARPLGDRFVRVGPPRPFRELATSEAALRGGVPTPVVVCASVYSEGIFYRGDLITEYVPDSNDLAVVLFDGSKSAAQGTEFCRVAALTAAGGLINRMAIAGIRHPDVNAKNILLHGDPGSPDAMLLDLDRCAISEPSPSTSATPMYRRLERSLRKWEGRTGRRLSDEERRALRAGLEVGP